MTTNSRASCPVTVAEDSIELVLPKDSWPEDFALEEAAIRAELKVLSGAGSNADVSADLRIEHFGSTAIGGIIAKPIIDLLIIPKPDFDWACLIPPLLRLGYKFWEDNPRADRMFFVKGMPPDGAGRTHHVHVRAASDCADELAFRDYLRSRPDIASAYATLKMELAAGCGQDREAYSAGKSAFIADVMQRITCSKS